MATQLRAVSPSVRQENTLILGHIIDGINQLDERKKELLSMLPHLADEEVAQTRMSARALGVWAWVIECACDAEILNRVEARRGRGNKDLLEEGRVAAVNKHAYQCGQTPATIYRNAQIYRRFENVLIDQNILDEKGYYEAALRAPDPERAIEVFAKEKDESPFFSVRDAHREAEKLKKQSEPKPPKLSEDLQRLHDAKVREDIDLTIAAIKTRNETSVTPLLARLNTRILEKLEWQRERTEQGDFDKIKEAITDGYQTGEQIFEWLSDRLFLMTDEEFDDRLIGMIDAKVIKMTKQGGKPDNARGDRTRMYVAYSARTGEAFTASRSSSIYDQGED